MENDQAVEDTVLWQTVSQVLAQFRSLTYVFDYVDHVFMYYPHQDLFINANTNADSYANGILTEAIQTAIREEGIENTPGWRMVRTSSGGYLYRFYCLGTLRSVNSVLTKGVLRGGGDTRFLMVANILFLWCASIPLGICTGLWRHCSGGIYTCFKINQIIKAVWCVFRLRSGQWMKRIQADEGTGKADDC